MLSVGFLSLYYTSLCMFAFVSHPVSYCLFLILCALGVTGYVYLIVGFSWYLILFCLVYIGGVYVLFIFVSISSPNPSPQLGSDFLFSLMLFSIFFFSFSFLGGTNMCLLSDGSHYICSYYEGVSYCFFCLVLMVGFSILSVVVSNKGSFFR